jgi:hypothetical protein
MFFLRIFSTALASLAIALSTACSNDSTFGPTPCPAILQAPPTLLYPKPGAAAVPINVGVVILSNVGPLGGSVTLTTAGSTVAAGSFGPAPSPLPSGAATPQPGATAQAASIPTLFANSSYSVNFTGNTGNGTSCPPLQSGGTLGTFST